MADRERRCAARNAELSGCQASPGWLVQLWEPHKKAESAACSRHLSRVCLQMMGGETHTLTLRPIGVRVPWLPGVTIGSTGG